jgi:hypothetical protein
MPPAIEQIDGTTSRKDVSVKKSREHWQINPEREKENP